MNAKRALAVATLVIAGAPNLVTQAATASRAAAADIGAAVVVDDDGVQCASAQFSSLAEAVMAAPAGGTVRVCPGLYRERVEINKPLRLIGQPDAVKAVDCFDSAWTGTTPLDTTTLPVLERPAGDMTSEAPLPLLRLNADGVEVSGLAIRSQVQPLRDDATYSPSIQTDGAHAGYWVHGNLVQGTLVASDRTFGIEFGSNGTALSRVDHNCLRGNSWALANQRYPTSHIRVDHNDTFRQGFVAYEIGWAAASISGVHLDHNVSVADGLSAVTIENAEGVVVDHNSAQGGTSVAMVVRGGNRQVTLRDNELLGGSAAGIALAGSSLAPLANPSREVVLDGNTIQGYTNGILLATNANTSDMVITHNITRANRLSGIQINLGNTGALLTGNVSDGNTYGIRTSPPTSTAAVRGNVITSNSMHGNVTDAVESTVNPDGTLGNVWTSNACETDSPSGAICLASSVEAN